jgi:hypothetical protein
MDMIVGTAQTTGSSDFRIEDVVAGLGAGNGTYRTQSQEVYGNTVTRGAQWSATFTR